MSSYGGGNGYYFNNHHYVDLCLNPQSLNVTTSSPVIIKCEGDQLNNKVANNNSLNKTNSDQQPQECNNEKKADAVIIKKEEIDTNEHPGDNEDASEHAGPEVDIMINNVVASFNVRCHLNLRQIALNGNNVEYRRENGMVMMKLRRPYTTASIWSSGKITCTGATSDDDAKIASRKIARRLQQLGFRVRFSNYRVVNVLCTCIMYFGINLIKFAEKHRGLVSYEPELHPGATFKVKELKATLKIFTTGSITVTAPSVRNAQLAIEHIFPLVEEFKTAKPPSKHKPVPRPTPFMRESVAIKRKCEFEDDSDGLSDEENVDASPELPDSDDSWE